MNAWPIGEKYERVDNTRTRYHDISNMTRQLNDVAFWQPAVCQINCPIWACFQGQMTLNIEGFIKARGSAQKST